MVGVSSEGVHKNDDGPHRPPFLLHDPGDTSDSVPGRYDVSKPVVDQTQVDHSVGPHHRCILDEELDRSQTLYRYIPHVHTGRGDSLDGSYQVEECEPNDGLGRLRRGGP